MVCSASMKPALNSSLAESETKVSMGSLHLFKQPLIHGTCSAVQRLQVRDVCARSTKAANDLHGCFRIAAVGQSHGPHVATDLASRGAGCSEPHSQSSLTGILKDSGAHKQGLAVQAILCPPKIPLRFAEDFCQAKCHFPATFFAHLLLGSPSLPRHCFRMCCANLVKSSTVGARTSETSACLSNACWCSLLPSCFSSLRICKASYEEISPNLHESAVLFLPAGSC